MRGKRALLSSVVILFLLLPATNVDWIIYSERLEPSVGDLSTGTTEGEINFSYGGEYRDGLIDNFDHFINPGYPSGYIQNAENTGVVKYAL